MSSSSSQDEASISDISELLLEGGEEVPLKKGQWTSQEDEILAEYVKNHGEGNWNAVQQNSGLARSGKSCRLRWTNHLRPNLKKGAFTYEEERKILMLHAAMGNKWSKIAAQVCINVTSVCCWDIYIYIYNACMYILFGCKGSASS